ncbi:unnamed protein product [Arabis nemorensis]|uniref:Uncharacterized protein n=1 Tax=Arabis nemorensis TaxID=586526 RepID=A0A565B4H3_9BRAS|nr:unnamed protein product [Arabis nemorensis]
MLICSLVLYFEDLDDLMAAALMCYGFMLGKSSASYHVLENRDFQSSLTVINADPKGLFPPEPTPYKGPKLKVVAGMSTALELLDQGHEVGIYDMIQGHSLVGSFVDRRGNHIEMPQRVFYGCYNNLFRLMIKVSVFQSFRSSLLDN